MDPLVTAAVVSGAANLVGGLFGSSSSKKAAEEAQQRNEALQREFAQNGIRWKVADAKAAGLHPLFALGGSGAAFTPSSVAVGEDPMASSLRSMGQDLSRAVAAQSTAEERQARQLNAELLRAQIMKTDAERMAIENQTQRSQQIAMSYPVMPSNLGGVQVRELPTVEQATNGRVMTQASGAFKVKPQEVPTHAADNPGRLPRGTPGYIITNQPDGSEVLMPAQGDQRMDEISVLDFIPWLRANLDYNSNFIGDYLLGPELNERRKRWTREGINAIRRSWRTPLQRLQDR